MNNSKIQPWQRTDYKSFGIMRLHEEIIDFNKYVSPTPLEILVRKNLIDKLNKIFIDKWPLCKMHVFGSFAADLYLPTSDIDLVLCGEWKHLPLRTIKELLNENNISNDIRIIDKAVVPIVKFVDLETGIYVDISINKMNGIENVDMIKKYTKKYEYMKPLFLVIKQFMINRDLTEVYNGGIGSFCLMLMLISYLQQYNKKVTGPINYGVLLMEFFELYSRSFNFLNTSISVAECRYRSKPDMNHNSLTSKGRPFKQSILSILDPLDKNNDVARSCYGLFNIRTSFAHAYTKLTSLVLPSLLKKEFSITGTIPLLKTSILGSIINIPENTQEWRTMVRDNFAHLVNFDEASINYIPPSETLHYNNGYFDSDESVFIISDYQESDDKIKQKDNPIKKIKKQKSISKRNMNSKRKSVEKKNLRKNNQKTEKKLIKKKGNIGHLAKKSNFAQVNEWGDLRCWSKEKFFRNVK